MQTKWFIKYSDYLLYGVYGLIATNFLSLILIFILRIMRCNDSVLKNQSSTSHVISIIILILIIINFLCSIAEDVLYYLAISYFLGDDEDGGPGGSGGSGGDGGGGGSGYEEPDDPDDGEESSDIENENKRRYLDDNDEYNTNIISIVFDNDINSDIVSIIKNTDAINNDASGGPVDGSTDNVNDEDEIGGHYNQMSKEKKYMLTVMNKMDDNIFREVTEYREKGKKLTSLPLIIMNINPFIQIISLIFIIFIIKRIKIKSHYGINSLNESSIRNQIGSTRNVRDINDNQEDNIFK